VYELVVLRARRRDNDCAERSRDLYGEVPEPARAGRDKQAVVGADAQLIGEALFSCQAVDSVAAASTTDRAAGIGASCSTGHVTYWA
jgi:hypothetical protein